MNPNRIWHSFSAADFHGSHLKLCVWFSRTERIVVFFCLFWTVKKLHNQFDWSLFSFSSLSQFPFLFRRVRCVKYKQYDSVQVQFSCFHSISVHSALHRARFRSTVRPSVRHIDTIVLSETTVCMWVCLFHTLSRLHETSKIASVRRTSINANFVSAYFEIQKAVIFVLVARHGPLSISVHFNLYQSYCNRKSAAKMNPVSYSVQIEFIQRQFEVMLKIYFIEFLIILSGTGIPFESRRLSTYSRRIHQIVLWNHWQEASRKYNVLAHSFMTWRWWFDDSICDFLHAAYVPTVLG